MNIKEIKLPRLSFLKGDKGKRLLVIGLVYVLLVGYNGGILNVSNWRYLVLIYILVLAFVLVMFIKYVLRLYSEIKEKNLNIFGVVLVSLFSLAVTYVLGLFLYNGTSDFVVGEQYYEGRCRYYIKRKIPLRRRLRSGGPRISILVEGRDLELIFNEKYLVYFRENKSNVDCSEEVRVIYLKNLGQALEVEVLE